MIRGKRFTTIFLGIWSRAGHRYSRNGPDGEAELH
jgi:hypothetical protein